MSVGLWAVADFRFRPIADTPVIRNRALRGRKADIRRVARSAGVRDWHGLARRALLRTSRQGDPMSSPNRSTSPQVYAAPAPALLDSHQGAPMKKYFLGLVALCILAR